MSQDPCAHVGPLAARGVDVGLRAVVIGTPHVDDDLPADDVESPDLDRMSSRVPIEELDNRRRDVIGRLPGPEAIASLRTRREPAQRPVETRRLLRIDRARRTAIAPPRAPHRSHIGVDASPAFVGNLVDHVLGRRLEGIERSWWSGLRRRRARTRTRRQHDQQRGRRRRDPTACASVEAKDGPGRRLSAAHLSALLTRLSGTLGHHAERAAPGRSRQARTPRRARCRGEHGPRQR